MGSSVRKPDLPPCRVQPIEKKANKLAVGSEEAVSNMSRPRTARDLVRVEKAFAPA
jgi:hypothetical protein